MAASRYHSTIYDLFLQDRQKDVDWYRKLAVEQGGRVLVLGCGTGRVLLPIARSGLEVVGVDLSQAMLSRCREKLLGEPDEIRLRVTLVEGDMNERLELGRFATVVMAFRVFLHNIDRERQLRCLELCRERLLPGGLLAFDVFQPSLDIIRASSGSLEGVWRVTDERESPDGFVLLSETAKYFWQEQRFKSRHRYECFGADGRLEETLLQILDLSFLFPGDVRDLLESAGFEEITIADSVDGSEDEEIVVRARVPRA